MSAGLDVRSVEEGYFLSRVEVAKPPVPLGAVSWKEANVEFCAGKSEEAFKNSLKNLRDHFDSLLPNERAGWVIHRNDGALH